jgi:MSHA biogenesis protein MshE
VNIKVQNSMEFIDFLIQTNSIDEALVTGIDFKKITDIDDFLISNKILNTSYLNSLKRVHERMSFVDLRKFAVDFSLVDNLPAKLVRLYKVILLKYENGSYYLGMENPLDQEAIDAVSSHMQEFVLPRLVDKYQLWHQINILYRRSHAIDKDGHRISHGLASGDDNLVNGKELLEVFLQDAASLNASDIHFESDKAKIRVRLRFDGVLDEQIIENKLLSVQIFQVLKMLANLDVAESMLPQDGGFQYDVNDKIVHIRLSIMPIENGQSAVIRLLKYSADFGRLDDILANPRAVTVIKRFLHRKEGMLLITGPTGSGKTTTLYTCIDYANTSDIKIMTIEDPIEMVIPGVNQIQANPEAGSDFSSVLKHTLRQDPDMILLGEIRDEESAMVATRAAITGHNVLSTLHTNNTPSTITRLHNLKVPGFQIANALDIVISQRLLRRLCPYCAEDYDLSHDDIVELNSFIDDGEDHSKFSFKECSGCAACNDTGFKGRFAVFEILVLDSSMKDAISKEDYSLFNELANRYLVGSRLPDIALECASKGEISFKEIFKV